MEQAGFRRGYSTVDHVLIARLLMEKCYEWSRPLTIAFIDFKKAFDSVEFPAIWKALDYYGVDQCTSRMTRQLYAAGRCSVCVYDKLQSYDIQRGVQQGYSLSPLLFLATLQHALSRIQWGARGIDIDGQRLRYSVYADDIAIFANNTFELQSMLNEVAEECEKVGLVINRKKTYWMSLSGRGILRIGNEVLEQVDSFIYLGVQLTIPQSHEKYPQEKEIGRRIGNGWATYNKARTLLRNPGVLMQTRRRYIHQCILPVIIYGCDSWTTTKNVKDRLSRCQRARSRMGSA